MEQLELATTRMSLHAVAEHLLAPDLWERTGRIGLRPTPGGFGQPEILEGGGRRRLRVDGENLVVLDGDIERWERLTTLRAAAVFAGADLGAPADVYRPETNPDPDAELKLDNDMVRVIAEWFALAAGALEEVRRRHAARSPTICQLWPEHFDVAFSMSEVNLGASPGDAAHPEPYLYVGPWWPVSGEPWNESWGMSLAWSPELTVDDAVGFLDGGFSAALSGRGAGA